MADLTALEEMAQSLLKEKGQEDVSAFLSNEETSLACIYLLGAVDCGYTSGLISFEKAAEYYTILGVGAEQASRLRQSRAGIFMKS